MKKIYLVLTAIALLAPVHQMLSQTIINNDTANKNRAYIRLGIEPTTMITFGYQRNFKIGFLNQNLTTYAEWGVSASRFSLKNSELKIGGILPLYQRVSFKIVNNLNLSAGSVETNLFESRKFAVADEVAIGFYKKNWFVAATAEYEKIFLNHITNTEFYKTMYYEDAKDGWYYGGGGMFEFGIEGGTTIKERYDIHLEVKMPFTEKFNGYGGSPLHLNLGVGYRF